MRKKTLRFQVLGVLLLGFLGACSGHVRTPTAAHAQQGLANVEGLNPISVEGLEHAYVQQNVDFTNYVNIMPGEFNLSFTRPDVHERRFPLDDTQKAEFKSQLLNSFVQVFKQSTDLPLASNSGAQTLLLNVRVQDIKVVLSPQSVGTLGIGSAALEAAGKATLLLELRDSQTEALVASAVDARALEGGAVLQKNDKLLTYWSELDTLCDYWAKTSHEQLLALLQAGKSERRHAK